MSENKATPLLRGYRVYVDDNYHFSDEDQRTKLGDFASYDEALAAARKVVEGFFKGKSGSEQELFKGYMGYGEDSWITPFGGETEGLPRFSSRKYAAELARSVAQAPIPPKSFEEGASV